jgi:hypothetical protein
MNPNEYIKKYGGKAGGFFYLRDLGKFEKHLPPLFAFLDKDRDFSDIADKFGEYLLPTIARATHENDHEGLVDILHTERDIHHRDDLRKAVEEIRERARDRSVFRYNEYEGNEYDGKVGILIQRKCLGVSGSIVEHPHKRGVYIVDFMNITTNDDKVIDHYVVDQTTMVDEPNCSLLNISGEVLRKVIELYKKVQESGFIPEDYSFQMEFGLNRSGLHPKKELVLFYQARPFKKFEEPRFELERRRKYQCFGMTPEQGIVLPVVRTEHQTGANNIQEPFAWIVENMTCKMSPSCQPRNMKAFLPLGLRVNSMQHNTHRWIRKADVSITSPTMKEVLSLRFETGDHIRIRSNGICFEVKRE